MNIKNIFNFCLAELLVWALMSLSYFFVSGFYPSWTGGIFTALFIVGNSFMFAAALFAVLALVRLIGPKTAFWTAVVSGGFFSLILGIDFIVYSQYRFHISVAMLQLFFGPAGREIFVFTAGTYLVLAGAVGAVFALTWGLAKLSCCFTFSAKKIGAVCAVLLLIFAGYNGLYAWGKFMLVPAVLTQVPYLPWAQPLSLNRRLRKMGFTPKTQPYETPRKGTIQYPLQPLSCQTEQTPNILVILIDSWRSDAFNEQVMPKLYRQYQKAKNVFYFTDHFSGGNATEAGVFSFFYSMPSSYVASISASETRPVLMQEMDRLGYRFGIYASGRLDSPPFSRNVFAKIDNLRISSKADTKWQRDREAQDEFLAFLDKQDKDKPFFGFLFYDATHGSEFDPQGPAPFQPSADGINYLTLTKNTDPAPYLNRYKNSAYYIDGLLDQVFSELQKRGLMENTLIVLTGDHGQEINDTRQNFWGHNSNFAKYQTRVPLLIWWPGKEGAEMPYRTSHFDLVPTLMKHIFHCSNPPRDYSLGTDLLDNTPRPYSLITSYTNKAILQGDTISVLNNYGSMTSYNENLQPVENPVSPQVMAEALKDFSHFYK
ncbi:sulfatase-like hydrolase/transferase [Candidatus Avelusimicrobium sp.]